MEALAHTRGPITQALVAALHPGVQVVGAYCGTHPGEIFGAGVLCVCMCMCICECMSV
jgi:hypothetical protein